MGVYLDDKKLVIIKTKSFHFETDHFVKHNGFLANERIKYDIKQLLPEYKHGTQKRV